MAQSNINKDNYNSEELLEYLERLKESRDVQTGTRNIFQFFRKNIIDPIGRKKTESRTAESNIVFDSSKYETIMRIIIESPELCSKIDKLTKKKEELEKINAELSQKNEELEKINNELSQKSPDLNKDELSQKNLELEKINAELSQKNEELEKINAELSQKNEELEKIKDKKEKSKKKYEKIIDQLQAKLDSATSYNPVYHKVDVINQTGEFGYKEQNQKLKSENEELIKKNREYEEKIHSYEKKEKNLETKIKELENQLNDLKNSSSTYESFASPEQNISTTDDQDAAEVHT